MRKPRIKATPAQVDRWQARQRRGDVKKISDAILVDVRTIRRAMKGEAVEMDTLRAVETFFRGRLATK